MTNEDDRPQAGRRELLRRVLRQQAILYASPTQSITQRDGSPAPWAFYSWNATLTSDGLRLAALNLLDRLQTFRSTQLASYGYTATPLLAACTLLGAGRYTGLCIREKRKTYLSGRRIEGPADRQKPVVIIDDSISSGTSLHRAIRALEDDGFQIEGALVLVNFPYRGGLEWANEVGYRVEALFDIWHDLEMLPPRLPNDEQRWDVFDGDSAPIPDGLHPALVARRTAEYYLTTGRAPRPPASLDTAYDGRGGVFVSFRDRATDFRLARDGFWHFDPQEADPARDVVAATIRTLQVAGDMMSRVDMERLKIAVTFFGPLERVLPRALDFERFGIVVRSSLWPEKLGGALPNTQVFTSEVEQYAHARDRNAGLGAQEPHELFRHTVMKCVEPGADWLRYGCPDGPEVAWASDQMVGARLTGRAFDVLLAICEGGSVAEGVIAADLIPHPIAAVGVTLYRHGFLSYGLAREGSLDKRIVEAVRQAVLDRRFAEHAPVVDPHTVSLAVSVLYSPEELGMAAIDKVATKLRRGLDSLSVTQADRMTTFLAAALPYNNWSKEEFVRNLLSVAGIHDGARSWTTYKTASWVRSSGGIHHLHAGFPVRSAAVYNVARCQQDITLLSQFILRNRTASGLPEYYQAPVSGEHQQTGTAARVIHAVMALDAAGRLLHQDEWQAEAAKALEHSLHQVQIVDGVGTLQLAGHVGGTLADCVLLAASSAHARLARTAAVTALAARIMRLFQVDGRIADGPTKLLYAHDHDFLPGAVLWALASYHVAAAPTLSLDFLDTALEWYRRRFRLLHTWGSVGWLCQGWAAIYQLTHKQEQAGFVFELADWALERQLEKNGAFLEDLSPYEPSFNTGFIAEGIAAAWKVAMAVGDVRRAQQYGAAWARAAQFLTQLIIYPEDTFCMVDPERAIGGVRTTPARSDIRIDQVSHCLHALVEGLSNM